MASSYTTNTGIEKPGDGEQAGLWGGTANTSYDILDAAINGVLALALTGTSSTLTTSDGVVSSGQYRVLVLGGSPSGAHTITVSPNDAQKLYFVQNSSGQSVVFTQGSGGNITIANGDSAVIYCDGAGATAAVANLTNNIASSSIKISGGAIDGTAIGGTTPAAGAFTTLALTTDLAVADGGTGVSTLTGIVKGNGTSAFSVASAGTDYLAPAAVGVTVQAYDAGLTSIAGLTTAADRMIYTTALDTYAVATLTAAGRAILDDADATAQRVTLGLVIGTDVAPVNAPTFTGVPAAPTAAPGANTTQVATTAFVTAAVAASGGLTLLGTLTTTSGTTQTLSGLVLTSYKGLLFILNGVSQLGGTGASFSVGAGVVQANNNASDTMYGRVDVDLTSGVACPQISRSTLPTNPSSNQIAQTGYSTATTSVSVTTSLGTFDLGSVLVYGVR